MSYDKEEVLDYAAKILSYEMNRTISPSDLEDYWADGLEAGDVVNAYMDGKWRY